MLDRPPENERQKTKQKFGSGDVVKHHVPCIDVYTRYLLYVPSKKYDTLGTKRLTSDE
jgi:hypothetical protein